MIRNKGATLTFLIAQLVSAQFIRPLSAYAEDSPASDAPMEKIEVTGSHIKRIDTEGASPVQTITRKEIEKTGYNSVADVLRDSAANSFGSAREASGSNAAGNAEVNLRGLGSSNTLVLLNGQRLPTDAITGAVDLNMIPLAAVERVEILKDGASAIYGSDALGGVVNIITRKDFSGTELSLGQSLPQSKGGARSDIGVVNGIQGEKLNMVNVFQYRDNRVVNSRDRSWTDHHESTIGNPGSYRDKGTSVWHADPNCPSGQVTVHTAQGDFCQFNTSDYSTELPSLEQFSLLSETNYELSSKVKLTARLGGTRRMVKWSYAPAPGVFTVPAASVPALPGHTPGQSVEMRYRLTDLGTRDSEDLTYGYNALLGASIQVSSGWGIDLTASNNKVSTDNKGVNGYALTDQLISDISSGTYNPFGTGNKGSLANARYVPLESTSSLIQSFEAKTSGELLQMPHGSLSLAAGVQVVYQKYVDNFDAQSVAGNVFGNAGSSGGGSRATQAAYSELSVPAMKNVEFQLAGRYDHYSDFGDTVNPKGAVLYHATKDLLFRGSVGTGFKAPLMQDLHSASSDGYVTFVDHVACNAEKASGGATPSCRAQQYEVISGGNPGLKQETSISYSAGTVYQATPTLSFGADWFLTKTKNVVGIDYEGLTIAQASGYNVNQHGIQVNRTGGYIDNIVAPLQNLSSQDVSGLDLSVGYTLGKFKLTTEQSQLFYFKEQVYSELPKENTLGRNGRPHWRNSTVLGYAPVDHQQINLIATTIGGHSKADAEEGSLSHYTNLDLQYVYTLKTQEFSIGLQNVLGTTPPLDDSNPTAPLDPTLYDQIGRQVLATYKVKF